MRKISMQFWGAWAGGILAAMAPSSRAVEATEVELLHNVPSTVLVSSSIRNGKDQPAHLVDGQLDTAWNSQSHVADHSFVDFVVPAAAQVRAIKMTVGFTSQNDKGDLFLLNRRITKVQVFRNGASLGKFSLDPKARGLQEIPIHQGGGHYRLQILGTLAGTNAKWTEACISELQVFGTPPPGVAPQNQMPTVFVGNVVEPSGAPVASLAAFCERWEKTAKVVSELLPLDKPWCRMKTDPGPGDRLESMTNVYGPSGRVERMNLGSGHSPFLAAQLIEAADEHWNTMLGLKTAKGWFVYTMYGGMDFDDTGCLSSEGGVLTELSGGLKQLVLRYRYIDESSSPERGQHGQRRVAEYKVACTPGDGDAPLCMKELVSLRWSEND